MIFSGSPRHVGPLEARPTGSSYSRSDESSWRLDGSFLRAFGGFGRRLRRRSRQPRRQRQPLTFAYDERSYAASHEITNERRLAVTLAARQPRSGLRISFDNDAVPVAQENLRQREA